MNSLTLIGLVRYRKKPASSPILMSRGIAFALSGGPKNSPAPVADPASDPEEADVSILRTEVPFGPFLALAAGIFTLFQPQLTHWYLGA